MPLAVMYTAIEVNQLPQTKNWRNIMVQRRVVGALFMGKWVGRMRRSGGVNSAAWGGLGVFRA